MNKTRRGNKMGENYNKWIQLKLKLKKYGNSHFILVPDFFVKTYALHAGQETNIKIKVEDKNDENK